MGVHVISLLTFDCATLCILLPGTFHGCNILHLAEHINLYSAHLEVINYCSVISIIHLLLTTIVPLMVLTFCATHQKTTRILFFHG